MGMGRPKAVSWDIKDKVIEVDNQCILGKLAQFYRVWNGFHFNTPQYEDRIFKDLVGSWITDFDTVEVYQQFLERFGDEDPDYCSSIR